MTFVRTDDNWQLHQIYFVILRSRKFSIKLYNEMGQENQFSFHSRVDLPIVKLLMITELKSFFPMSLILLANFQLCV